MKERVEKFKIIACKTLSIFAAALVLFTGCSKKEAAGGQGNVPVLETIRLGVMADTISAYIAEIGNEEGLFAKYGLKTDVASFAVGINTVDAVTVGQMDIGYAADFAMINRLGGSPNTILRIFSGLGEGRFDSWKLYGRGAGINSPADLPGKSVVTQLGTVIEYWHAKTYAATGVDSSKINFLPVESTMEGVALIQSGAAVAMWANARPAESLNKIDGVHPITDLTPVGAPTLNIALTTDKFLKEHHSAVVKYVKVVQEVYDLIEKDPQRAAEIVNKRTATPVEQALITIRSQVNYVDLDQRFFDALSSLYGWTEQSGIIKYPYDLHTYVDTTALQEAFPGRGNFK
ncbi:ABC transporter substrate-binding protein [Treponema primitia]|uniref:ABC transporter substrate-binding protein n=1 Tax=Treponema primitia TaxID=88058 RepID=UPI0039815EE0